MENEETTQAEQVETAAAKTTAKKNAKKNAKESAKKSTDKKSAQSGETVLQKVGKAAIVRHGFSAVYVTSDGQAFAQEGDAKNHASDLKSKDIIKVTKQ